MGMRAAYRMTSAVLLVALAGCTVAPIKPWQRAHLASPAMDWDMHPLTGGYQQHIEVSKEAASGGNGIGGSACGCN